MEDRSDRIDTMFNQKKITRTFSSILILILSSLIFAGCNPLDFNTKSGLQVITGEISASLFLDDQYLETTPYINKKIKPGSYSLRIQPADSNLIAYETPITLRKGLITVVSWKPGETSETSGGVIYEVEKLKNNKETILEFQTVPDNAIIHFDESVKQFTPLILNDVVEGNHSFEISLPSYETQKHSVKALKGHRVVVTLLLNKEGSLPTPTPTPKEETLESEESSSSSKLAGPKVQIVSTKFFVDDQEVLRVRSTPSASGIELGFAVVGQSYEYLDEKTGWFQIKFQGEEGWISSDYSQKIE